MEKDLIKECQGSKIKQLQKNLYLALEEPSGHSLGFFVQVIVFANIVISIVALFLEHEPSFQEYGAYVETVSLCTIVVFTVEYILRLYAVGFVGVSRFRFALRPFMLIDLVVLLPFYLSFLGVDLNFLRGLRFLRIFKLFRLGKFSEFDDMLLEILMEKKEELMHVVFVLMVLLLTISPVVYFVEKDIQPEVFNSLSSSLWWAVVTFTTVGYGDMYPVTFLGKLATTVLSFLGIAFYAIPGSILTSALLDKISDRKNKSK